jgi:hypothetical protein
VLLDDLCADAITRYCTGNEDDPAISGPADGFSTRSEAFDIEFDTFGHRNDGSAMAIGGYNAT